MPNATKLKLRKRGRITLPKALRDVYSLKPGDHLSLTDIGGALVFRRDLKKNKRIP